MKHFCCTLITVRGLQETCPYKVLDLNSKYVPSTQLLETITFNQVFTFWFASKLHITCTHNYCKDDID